MIGTARLLINELKRKVEECGDSFVTIRLGNREYMIDWISSQKSNTDPESTHICLDVSECSGAMYRR